MDWDSSCKTSCVIFFFSKALSSSPNSHVIPFPFVPWVMDTENFALLMWRYLVFLCLAEESKFT